MSTQGAAAKRRDKLLLQLLKTAPQPRPKRVREIKEPPKRQGSGKSRKTVTT